MTDSNIRWPIERLWTVVSDKGARSDVTTTSLVENRVCRLLGAAGLGKTYELQHMSDIDSKSGKRSKLFRLAELAQTADVLESKLTTIASSLDDDDVLYLDALDELMIPVPVSSLILTRWIKESLSLKKPRLRISCRSAVWPTNIEAALREVYGDDRCMFASLQPLSNDDIRTVALSRKLDAAAFLTSVETSGASILASQPLTLEMLLQIFATHGALPQRRNELFKKGLERLADERIERRDSGTQGEILAPEILDAGERLACYLLFSGRDTVDIGDNHTSTLLNRYELQELQDGCSPFNDKLLAALRNCGLTERAGSNQFRFAHRQFAEYLAGRRISKMLTHQAKALLSVSAGWRLGVAGPLRETAALAAVDGAEIALWIAQYDPEIVGLSDVADATLRRQATLNLLDRFRRRELTDDTFRHDEHVELQGLKYEGAEKDLREILKERQTGCDDVLDFAIKLVENWRLTSLSESLADLALDTTAPLEVRKAAGHAILSVGTNDSKRRLLPLANSAPEDRDFDLKGIALACNWPDRITTQDLLKLLTPSPRRNYHGAYSSFLHSLIPDFNAAGYRTDGLIWAHTFLNGNSRYSFGLAIVGQIAKAALNDLDDQTIVRELVALLAAAADKNVDSPLGPPGLRLSNDDQHEAFVLTSNRKARRQLLDAIASAAISDHTLWSICQDTPGLLSNDDFEWLIEQAADPEKPIDRRTSFASIAKQLPWWTQSKNVDIVLAKREIEPIKSQFSYPLSVDLDSDEAKSMRKLNRQARARNQKRTKRSRLKIAELILRDLELSESKDYKFFRNLCSDLTLKEDSEFIGCNRTLIDTSGWLSVSKDIQKRIVEAAKRYLANEQSQFDVVRKEPLNSIHIPDLAAILLVLREDVAWIDCLPDEWWNNWCWHILREFHFHLYGESDAIKLELFQKLMQRAPYAVEREIDSLALSQVADSARLLSSILEQLRPCSCPKLVETLAGHLKSGAIPDDKVYSVAEFILLKDFGYAENVCATYIDAGVSTSLVDRAVDVALAMLKADFQKSWRLIYSFIKARPDVAHRVLAEFASSKPHSRHGIDNVLMQLTHDQYVELISVLFDFFPPEKDPVREGAFNYGSDDYARDLRDGLVSMLGNRKDKIAVVALKRIEAAYGNKYAWLRRPRARAERAARLLDWTGLPLTAIATVLKSTKNRLLRSTSDVMDGIVEAITSYEQHLRGDRLNDLDDFWNRQRRGLPIPKDEERVSDKVCDLVRDYFKHHAVTADREVQLFRRKLPKIAGGAPGSEADVLITVPVAGTEHDDAIVVVIEVKLAQNPEARTGLRDQLVARYMVERNAQGGLFVVAWMGTQVPRHCKPIWQSNTDATMQLESQAAQATLDSGTDIRALVVDLSLPTLPKKQSVRITSSKKRRATKPRVGGQGTTRRSPKNGKRMRRRK